MTQTGNFPGLRHATAPAPQRITVLLNAKAGARNKNMILQRLEMLCQARALQPDIHLLRRGDAVFWAARQAQRAGSDLVVAGGGDGTINAAASALLGSGTTLGVLPLGTFNYFARDLGIPLDLEAAVDVLFTGRPRTVNVGEVNGRTFLNTSSIGLHSRMLAQGERVKARFGRRRWVAAISALVTLFKRHRHLRLRLGLAPDAPTEKVLLAFLSISQVQLGQFDARAAECLNTGRMCLYLMYPVGRWGMLRLALSALFRRLHQVSELELRCIEEAWLDTPRRSLHVTLDGEIVNLAPPLRYRLLPNALSVMVPAEASDRPAI